MKFKRLISVILVILILFLTLPISLATGKDSLVPAKATSKLSVNEHPSTPGEVKIFKTAEAVEGMVNTWDITLRIEGKDKKSTSDIVLVMDTSDSMNNYGRLGSAKNAAVAFVNKLLPSGTNRLALVEFNSNLGNIIDLTNNKSTLITKINGLTAEGGTFTQAGIRKAKEILNSSNATNKHIVLLSDGEPTYSYGVINPDYYLVPTYIEEYSFDYNYQNYTNYYNNIGNATKLDISEDQYEYTQKVGNGSAMFHAYKFYRKQVWNGWTWEWVIYYDSPAALYNHGNSAINEAKFAKDTGYVVWSVALNAGNLGEYVLKKIASDHNKYYEATTNDLEGIFENIAGKIVAAASNAEVIDPMGIGFEISDENIANIEASQGNASYDAETKTISWNPGTLTEPIEDGSDIKYAQLKYRVEINDDILGIEPNTDGEYSANGEAKVTYIDINGERKTESFPVPKVNPVLYRVEKELQDESGNVLEEDKDFSVKVVGENYDKTYTLNPSGVRKTKLLTDLRLSQTYSFEETGVDPSYYKIEYYINGELVTDENKKFRVVDDNTEDVVIKIVNKKLPTNLIIEKIDNNNFPVKDVIFTLSKANDNWELIDDKIEKTTELNEDKKKAIATFENLKPGKYILEESYTPNEYIEPKSKWHITVDDKGRITVDEIYEDNKISETIGEGKVITLRISNERKSYELPVTGGLGTNIFRFGGLIILFLYVISLYSMRGVKYER